MDVEFLRGRKAWRLGDVVVLVPEEIGKPDTELLNEALLIQLIEQIKDEAGAGDVFRVIDTLEYHMAMMGACTAEMAAGRIVDEFWLKPSAENPLRPADLDQESLEELTLDDVVSAVVHSRD